MTIQVTLTWQLCSGRPFVVDRNPNTAKNSPHILVTGELMTGRFLWQSFIPAFWSSKSLIFFALRARMLTGILKCPLFYFWEERAGKGAGETGLRATKRNLQSLISEMWWWWCWWRGKMAPWRLASLFLLKILNVYTFKILPREGATSQISNSLSLSMFRYEKI